MLIIHFVEGIASRTCMYSISDRIQVLNELEAVIYPKSDVAGLILVGSGAYGFRDRFSDLDVVIVLADGTPLEGIYEDLDRWLSNRFHPLKHKLYRHAADVFVACYLLENHLNIDIGIWTAERLVATKPNWRVIFDRGSSLEGRLDDSWNTRKSNTFESATQESLTFIWEPIRAAVVALRRWKPISCQAQMEILRREVINLICAKHGVSYDQLSRVDEIEDAAVQALIEARRAADPRAELDSLVSIYFSLVHQAIPVLASHEELVIRELIRDLCG